MITVVCWPSLLSSMGESWVGLAHSKRLASHRSSDQTVTGETVITRTSRGADRSVDHPSL